MRSFDAVIFVSRVSANLALIKFIGEIIRCSERLDRSTTLALYYCHFHADDQFYWSHCHMADMCSNAALVSRWENPIICLCLLVSPDVGCQTKYQRMD